MLAVPANSAGESHQAVLNPIAFIEAGGGCSDYETDVTEPVGAPVAAQLGLTLGPAASFAPFVPGVAKDYTASTTATVVSTAGSAALTFSAAP